MGLTLCLEIAAWVFFFLLLLLRTRTGLSGATLRKSKKCSVKNKKLFERSEFFLFSVTFGFLGEPVQPRFIHKLIIFLMAFMHSQARDCFFSSMEKKEALRRQAEARFERLEFMTRDPSKLGMTIL